MTAPPPFLFFTYCWTGLGGYNIVTKCCPFLHCPMHRLVMTLQLQTHLSRRLIPVTFSGGHTSCVMCWHRVGSVGIAVGVFVGWTRWTPTPYVRQTSREGAGRSRGWFSCALDYVLETQFLVVLKPPGMYQLPHKTNHTHSSWYLRHELLLLQWVGRDHR